MGNGRFHTHEASGKDAYTMIQSAMVGLKGRMEAKETPYTFVPYLKQCTINCHDTFFEDLHCGARFFPEPEQTGISFLCALQQMLHVV